MMIGSRGWLLLFSLGLLACGDDATTTSRVGPAGGDLRLGDDAVRLSVPPGAATQEVEITLRRLPDSELPPNGIPGTAIELGPSGAQFSKPVQLAVGYRMETLTQSDTAWLRLVEVKPDGKLGATLFIGHDLTAHTVTAGLTHFSKYALVDLKTSKAVVTTSQKPVTDVDVLFLVDNSNSMEEEQKNLAANFPKLITKLDAAKVGYRIGVTTADLGAGPWSLPSCEVIGGDGGKLQSKPGKLATPGCPTPSDPWIEKTATGSNVPGGDVAAAFSCIASIGTGGCGFEQTLEAIFRAVDPGVNPGFIRPAAGLAVVIISDEDDCSAENSSLYDPNQQGLTDLLGPLTSFRCFEFGITCDVNGRTPGARKNCVPGGSYLFPIARYVDQLKKLKPAGQLLVSAIVAPAEPVEVGVDGMNPSLKPSCSSANGHGAPAIRIKSVVDAFGALGSTTNICDSDFGPALTKVGDLLVSKALLTWCVALQPVDTNPLTPELDADCMVASLGLGQIPACTAGSTKPCYRLTASAGCGTGKMQLQLDNTTVGAVGTDVAAVCLTQF